MSVKIKTILLTAITLIVMGGGIFLLSQDYLRSHFTRLEASIHQKDLYQVIKSIDRVYAEIGNLAIDWATWDDTDQYLKGDRPDFIEENFNPDLFRTLGINLVILADSQGKVHFAQRFDLETDQLVPVEGQVANLVSPGGLFSNFDPGHDAPEVLLRIDDHPYLVTGRAVYPTSGQGESSGVLLFGRELDESLLDTMRVDSGVETIQFYFPDSAPPDYRQAMPKPGYDPRILFHDPAETMERSYIRLAGASGETTGLLEVQLERTIFTEGSVAVRYLLGGMILIGAAALLVNLLITNFLLFRPLEQLTLRVKQASNLEEQIQTLADRPVELQVISEPLETVLVRAQQTQQESLDRQTLYTRLFEQAREGFAILDPDSLQILEANQEFINLLAWDRQQEPEVSFHQLIGRWVDAEVAQKLLASETEVAEGKARLREQEVKLHGLDRDVEISISPILAGQNRYLYALLRDVSERKQLEETLKDQLRETTLLNQVIAVTTSNLEPTAVFETVCRELSVNLGLPQSALALFDAGRTGLEVVAEYTKRRIPSSIGMKIEVRGVAGLENALTHFDPLQIDINQSDPASPELRDLLEKRGTESALLVPLIVRDEIIGWLVLEDTAARQFDEEEVRLAQHMALAASRAYEVTALYHNLQDELARRQEAEATLDKRKRYLEELVNVLMDLLSLEKGVNVYDQVLPLLGALTGMERATVFELFPSADGHAYLRPMNSWIAPDTASQLQAITDSFAVIGDLEALLGDLQSGQLVSGGLDGLPEALRRVFGQAGARSMLILPLYQRSELKGIISFDSSSPARHWDELQAGLLQAAAAAVSMTRERIETSEALSESESHYRLVVENARDVIFQIDMTGRFTFLNPAWETITGLKVEDTVGLPFWKAAPESMVQELGAGFRILREHVTDRYHQTITIKNVHDRTVWLDAYIRIVADPSGSGQMIAGTLVDITSYKRIEYILRHNEEALRSLYDITSSLSLTFEKKLRNLLMMGAQTFELDFGYLGRVEGDELILEYAFPEMGHSQPQKVEIGLTFTRETLRANEPLGLENVTASDWANHPACTEGGILAYLGTSVMVDKDVYGVLAFYHQSARASAFSLAEKEFVRLMAQWIGSEIERMRYTRQLQAFNEEIAEKSRQLAEARDQALEASRLKSEFLATMSHEIRTPLNAVIGMAELLMETPLNAEQADFTRIIRESGRSLLTIINDILDFSKIEAGRMALETVDFEILPLVDSVLDMFAQAVQKKGIGLYSFVSPEVPAVLSGDPGRLRQVLTNLVGNGVKFTDNGEVVLRVDLRKRQGEKAELLFKVSDSGIGLSDVARKRLFNPFTQADGSTTRKYGGTGLGLAISRRLVELMGGEIGVKSVEGVGSTFWFTVTLGVNAAEESASVRKSPDLSHSRVLIIDGHPAQRRLMSTFIRSWGGVEPDTAWDDATAIELITSAARNGNQGYQLIIYDLNSPSLDPAELERVIYGLGGQAGQTIFIFLAGYDQRDLAESLIRGRRAAYLVKPVRQSVFFDLIANIFENADLSQEQRRVLTVGQDVPENLVEPETIQPVGAGLILLAEDNPANQRLATVQLKRLGYQAELASNGGQALAAYLNAPDKYAMILMDCQMPVMDGFEATKRIRAAEKETGGHIPIIAMTANAMQGDREACIEAGMDEYVSKPVSLESLRTVLSRMKEALYEQKGDTAPIQAMPSPYNPLDENVLAGLRDLQEEGEPDFLTELIDIYLEDSARLVEEIRSAVKEGEVNRVRNAAHTLKGSSGNLGANAFSRLCYEMELAARNNDIQSARKLLPTLVLEYDQVRERLSMERKVEN